ncbi:MAG: class I SAM-dependent methyltransferase [Steroidobacteraceae bacterium]
MTTDYNKHGVARQYQQAKQQPWRHRVEAYSFLRCIGDLAGKSVVDMACGEGHFTRQLKLGGARTVMGFDVSERMVELARAQEADDPSGIEYVVHDARELAVDRAFDLAVSAWLLVYAREREELARMCRGIASWLRPGGRFVTFTTNPDLYLFQPRGDFRPYGFEVLVEDQVYEGAPITWRIHMDDTVLDIENYYLPISAYESACREAGFRDFRVHGLELAPAEDGVDDRKHWAEFMRAPPAVMLECVRE